MLKRAGGFTAHPTAVAILPDRFFAGFIINNLKAVLVWPAWGQSERK
jgi:hypothetical protein